MNILPRLSVTAVFALALTGSLPLAAAQPTAMNLDELEKIVISTLGADIGEPGGPLAPIDRRMRLSACPAGVQIDPPALSAVAVRCPAAGWRIRIPLTHDALPITGKQRSTAATPTANAAVRRGDPVQLIAQGSSFQVSIDATAMEDADIGGRVRVSTGSKGSTMFAEVVDVGRVRVIGFK
jgi:flagella basal body P-ring formation protein FlgA